jgi:hypothetical protein
MCRLDYGCICRLDNVIPSWPSIGVEINGTCRVPRLGEPAYGAGDCW